MADSVDSQTPILLRALHGERTERTPVWLMRQAGRSDPDYRAYRQRFPLPLEQLFRDPEHAYRISLLPKRVGVDAIIFFQDILTPLAPMGAEFRFRPGPVLEERIHTRQQIESLREIEPEKDVPFVGETLSELRRDLENEVALLGFAGAPMTLLFFLVSGRSPGGGETGRDFLSQAPDLAHHLLEKLAEMTAVYLDYQVESGAQAVQLFESVADLVSEDEYRDFALPYQTQVFERMKSNVPRILFAKQFANVKLMKQSGAEVLSVGGGKSLRTIREELGESTVLQGNIGNSLLREGSPEQVEEAVRKCIDDGGSRGHVLNLDHGILPDTPWKNVEHLVRTAREYRAEVKG